VNSKHRFAPLAALALAVAAALPAQAGIFDDDEARKAILDLRERIRAGDEQNRRQAEEANAQTGEQLSQIKRSLLELNNAIEALRTELAKMRGNDEQLARDISDLQRRQKDIAVGVDERIRKMEPVKVTLDGREFSADPEEKRQFDDAMALLRNSDFAGAATAFGNFSRRYPAGGFSDAARFWLGNAQYGKRDYKDAVTTLRSFVAAAPDHPRAPEALLAVANCQLELKDSKTARRTLDELTKTYPQSEAALAGKERLAGIKP
jgi:tol-pal system protein YbgF